MNSRKLNHIPTDVPDDVEPDATCPYCDRPFPETHLRDLHVGERHQSSLSEADEERYHEAVDRESDELFVLHLEIVGGLVLSFFALAYLYVFVLS